MRLGISLALTQPRRPAASSFDPLNPPGGAPVAAWLASDLVAPWDGVFWNDHAGLYTFDLAALSVLVPTLVTVGGKNRVRCPSASNVAGGAVDTVNFDPFSVPTGACSIVLVSAALVIEPDVGRYVLSNDGDPASLLDPNLDSDPGIAVASINGNTVSDFGVHDTNPHVMIFQKAVNWRYFVDAEDRTNVDPLLSGNWGQLWIGASQLGQYPNHDIVAILIFNRVLTAPEIADYTTWGIAEAGA